MKLTRLHHLVARGALMSALFGAGVLAAGLASPANAQPQTAEAREVLGRSLQSSGILDALAMHWRDVEGVSLQLAGDHARAQIALASDGTLAYCWYDTTSRSDVSPARVPDTMLYFANNELFVRRGTYDPAATTPRPAHYVVTKEADLWQPSPGPSQLLLAPWPRVQVLAKELQAASDVRYAESSGTAWASSEKRGALIEWRVSDGQIERFERTSSETRLRESAVYVYGDAASRFPTAIELSVYDASPEAMRDAAKSASPLSRDRWRVTRAETNPHANELRFDAAKWNLVRFDPMSNKLIAPDGSVVGGELNTSIAGLTDAIENNRAKSFDALAKWGGIAAGLLVLGVIVDMIRRRL